MEETLIGVSLDGTVWFWDMAENLCNLYENSVKQHRGDCNDCLVYMHAEGVKCFPSPRENDMKTPFMSNRHGKKTDCDQADKNGYTRMKIKEIEKYFSDMTGITPEMWEYMKCVFDLYASERRQEIMERFVKAQNHTYEGYEMALEEMRAGRKQSHWIWYIFPQLAELGYSWNAKYYGISGLEEAREYVQHPILRDRLIEISEVVLHSDVSDVEVLMNGYTDAMKLRSSMTLFAIVAPDIEMFEQVLEKYFGGKMDGKTVRLMEESL